MIDWWLLWLWRSHNIHMCTRCVQKVSNNRRFLFISSWYTSHSPYVVWVYFISERRNLQFNSDSEHQIIKKLFKANILVLGVSRSFYVSFCSIYLRLGLNHELSSNFLRRQPLNLTFQYLYSTLCDILKFLI